VRVRVSHRLCRRRRRGGHRVRRAARCVRRCRLSCGGTRGCPIREDRERGGVRGQQWIRGRQMRRRSRWGGLHLRGGARDRILCRLAFAITVFGRDVVLDLYRFLGLIRLHLRHSAFHVAPAITCITTHHCAQHSNFSVIFTYNPYPLSSFLLVQQVNSRDKWFTRHGHRSLILFPDSSRSTSTPTTTPTAKDDRDAKWP